jgi:hypothetical protein
MQQQRNLHKGLEKISKQVLAFASFSPLVAVILGYKKFAFID